MSDPAIVLTRYNQAQNAYTRICQGDPSRWHRPDIAEFAQLRILLTPHAEAGDLRCQYALAAILWMGLCCKSEEQYFASYQALCHEATPWLVAAASQGDEGALDNLVSFGAGPEAERARRIWNELKSERPDLVSTAQGMPLYGPDFMDELVGRYCGRPGAISA